VLRVRSTPSRTIYGSATNGSTAGGAGNMILSDAGQAANLVTIVVNAITSDTSVVCTLRIDP
jgi:hypothetical protein